MESLGRTVGLLLSHQVGELSYCRVIVVESRVIVKSSGQTTELSQSRRAGYCRFIDVEIRVIVESPSWTMELSQSNWPSYCRVITESSSRRKLLQSHRVTEQSYSIHRVVGLEIGFMSHWVIESSCH